MAFSQANVLLIENNLTQQAQIFHCILFIFAVGQNGRLFGGLCQRKGAFGKYFLRSFYHDTNILSNIFRNPAILPNIMYSGDNSKGQPEAK